MTIRVGVIGPVRPDDFADNLAAALETGEFPTARLGAAQRMFSSAVPNALVDLATRGSSRSAAALQRGLVKRAAEFGCDLIITVDARLEPDTVRTLQRGGARVALWYPDAVANMGRQLMLRAPYDHLYFKEPHVVERLRLMLDLPVSYLPEACNPEWHKSNGPGATEPHILVAGNLYPSRVRLLDRLLEHDIPLRLHSGSRPAWLDSFRTGRLPVHRYLRRAEKALAFRQAAGVLNNLHPAELRGVNCRLFEAAACGAAVLCEERPALETLFDRESELFTFSRFEDLLLAARLVLQDGNTAQARGDAAAVRAHAEHTYRHRIEQIMEDLT